MIGHHTRLQGNDDLPKLCAVMVRNAILRNDMFSQTQAIATVNHNKFRSHS